MIQNRFLFLLTFTVTLMATDDFSILPVVAKSEQWSQMAREAVAPTGHSEASSATHAAFLFSMAWRSSSTFPMRLMPNLSALAWSKPSTSTVASIREVKS